MLNLETFWSFQKPEALEDFFWRQLQTWIKKSAPVVSPENPRNVTIGQPPFENSIQQESRSHILILKPHKCCKCCALKLVVFLNGRAGLSFTGASR